MVVLLVEVLIGKSSNVHVNGLDLRGGFSSLLAIIVDPGERLLSPPTHLLLLLSDLPNHHAHVVWRESNVILLQRDSTYCPTLSLLSRVVGKVLSNNAERIWVSEKGRLVLSGALSIVQRIRIHILL